MQSSTRRFPRLLSALAAALASALASPLGAAITTLRFDSTPIDTVITNQYEAQGVIFSAGAYSVHIVDANPPGTFSGSQALEVIYGGDIPDHPGPMKFRFTSLQRRVRVYVGQHWGGNPARSEAVLKVFDNRGTLIEKKYALIGGGPRVITLPIEIDAGSNRIYRAEVQFLRQDMLDDVYFEIDTHGVEIIDNLIFEGDDPPPPPPDDPPVVRITRPANGQIFFADASIRLEGTVTEDSGLGRVTLNHLYLDEDPDPAPWAMDWAGAAPNFTFPRFPDIFRVHLHTGRNRLTVEAEDSRGQTHSRSVDVILAPAPVVTITSPADESTTAETEWNVRGRIVKPYGVLPRAQVTIAVEDSGRDPVAVDSLSGNATDGYTFSARVALMDRVASHRNRIRVEAVDEGGAVGRAWADLMVNRPNRASAAGLDVTQAVLDSRLVAGRRTVARLYATPAGGAANNVRAELRGFRDGVELAGSPLSPWGPDELDLDPADGLADRQNDQDKSWDFVLPGSWRNTRGSIDLVAVIDPDNDLEECDLCEDNNVLERAASFSEGAELRVRPVKVSFLEDGTRREPTDDEIEFALEGIKRAYPYGTLTILSTRSLRSSVDLGSDFDDGTDDILEEVYDEFTCYDSDVNEFDDIFGWLWDQIAGCSWSTYNIGFLDMMSGGTCPGGLAYVPSPGCISEVNPWVAAQELAHCVGLEHAGNSHGEDDGGGFDPGYPYAHGGTGEVGFDTQAMVAIPTQESFPAGSPDLSDTCRQCDLGADACHTHDFMSYGDGPSWISDYTWRGIYNNGFTGEVGIFGAGGGMDELAAGGGAAFTEVLHVQGKVRDDGSLHLRPLYLATPPAGLLLGPGTGAFEGRALDAAGKVLAARRFDGHRSTHGHSERISALLPFVTGTAQVVILRDGKPLASRSVSANPPKVAVTYPNGGESFAAGQGITLRWKASDADGDALRFGVQYTPDDGKSWTSLGFGIDAVELEVRLAELPGGRLCRFRVLATDGVLSSRDVSDAVFAVGAKVPYPVILYPRKDEVVDPADALVLEGTASDLEEGSVASLLWSSDRDGVLGKGRSVDVPKLSPGTHRVTLEAIDRSGAGGKTEITVHVGTSPPAGGGKFVRGNMNGEEGVNIADPISLLGFLFIGGKAPACEDAADANDDGKLDLSDATYTLNYLFLGGPAPRPPFPQLGTDPTADGLSCRA